MKFIPALVTTAKVVSVTVEPSVCCITILYPLSDDVSNETAIHMLLVIQNAPR